MNERRHQPPAITIDQYRAEVAPFPPPTHEQVRDFVEFVAGARSWYKHLPRFTFVDFWFYLNPTSGMDAAGKLEFRDRTDDSPRFHYTWMTTAEYRRRFGVLDYHAQAGTSFRVGSTRGVIHVGLRQRPLPPRVMEVGRAGWTAAVHDIGGSPYLWKRELGKLVDPTWPPESGGSVVLDQIGQIVEKLGPETWNHDADKMFDAITTLIGPERTRQRREAEAAIGRVVSLIYPGAELQ